MNKIELTIKEFEKKFSIHFKPTQDFYKRVGIGRKRFAQLLKNEVSVTIEELHKLKEYFQLENITELIENK